MPGYPNERQAFGAVFVTRHSVLIVPAAPCREATLTVAVLSAQRAIAAVDPLVDVLGAGSVVGTVDCAVEASDPVADEGGAAPASRAPPLPQPATREARARAERSALVMRPIVPEECNRGGTPR